MSSETVSYLIDEDEDTVLGTSLSSQDNAESDDNSASDQVVPGSPSATPRTGLPPPPPRRRRQLPQVYSCRTAHASSVQTVPVGNPLHLPYPEQRPHQKVEYVNAPVTTAIALGNSRFNPDKTDWHYEKWEFIYEQLEHCMKLMYKPELGTHVCGYDVPCKIALALQQEWTVTSTMSVDGMPQNERETVLAVLELFEKYLVEKKVYIYKNKNLLDKIYQYLENVTLEHFVFRETLTRKHDDQLFNFKTTSTFTYPNLCQQVVKTMVNHGSLPSVTSICSKQYGDSCNPILIDSSDDEHHSD